MSLLQILLAVINKYILADETEWMGIVSVRVRNCQ